LKIVGTTGHYDQKRDNPVLNGTSSHPILSIKINKLEGFHFYVGGNNCRPSPSDQTHRGPENLIRRTKYVVESSRVWPGHWRPGRDTHGPRRTVMKRRRNESSRPVIAMCIISQRSAGGGVAPKTHFFNRLQPA